MHIPVTGIGLTDAPANQAPVVDWRDCSSYYKVESAGARCDVCGSTHALGIEPRFGYISCESCKDVPPARR